MFRNLVESNSHKKDLRRRGGFFLGTLALYSLLLLSVGVATVFAYDAHLENQNLELLTVFSPVAPDAPVQIQRDEPRRTSSDNQIRQNIRTAAYNTIANTMKSPSVSTTRNDVSPVPRYERFEIGNANVDVPIPGNTNNLPDGTNGGNANPNGNSLPPPKPEATPRAIERQATPPAVPRAISTGVLEGKAIAKPAPAYPQPARIANISGIVTVQIVVDEAGRVVSAQVAAGHPLLRQAATQAAYRARFSPTLLSGQAVKVTGVITYNFKLQ